MKKKVEKFFIRGTFVSTLLLSSLIVILKLYIPIEYEFIEPISIYGTILSSVIFIYGFILSPAISEYKESEKILSDIKATVANINDDIHYFFGLKSQYDSALFFNILSRGILDFYSEIADNEKTNYLGMFYDLNKINLDGEKYGIPANHIIRMKQELSILKKCFLRIAQIKEKETLPHIIYKLKNFITFMVITMLLFMNMGNGIFDIVSQIQESVMIFLISFLYIYLSFIINGFDNPFDKRKFSGFLDLSFLKDIGKKLQQESLIYTVK